MATQVTNYQCPGCTGPLQYSPDSGKLDCEYCGSIYELDYIEELYREKEEQAAEEKVRADETADEGQWDASELGSDWGQDAEGMKVYTCPACTAELFCDESTAATNCPYCGNPTVVPGQFTGALKPDFVIPFKLDRDAAVAALKQHYHKRFFLPKTFSQQNQIEKVQGVYVPFWLFDAEAEGYGRYKATRSRSYTRGDYRITETSHYMVSREGRMSFEKVPVDASTKMPDGHMDSVEPFDYSELKPFSTAYLPGFLADKFDVEVEGCRERADLRCRRTLEDALRDSVSGYDSVNTTGGNVTLHRGKVRYALLPVWLLSTKWNGQNFLFAMNGQTGKLVGDLPVNKKKYWLTFFGIGIALSIISSVLVFLFA